MRDAVTWIIALFIAVAATASFAPLFADDTSLSAATERALQPKQQFKECSICPEMVVIPAGEFMMGRPINEGRIKNEIPQHKVTIARAFAVAKFEATFDEWDACYERGGCKTKPKDQGLGRGSQAVTSVSWDDAQDYLRWLSMHTGKRYRLLSESEWEYAARAGSNAAYSWGDEIGKGNTNCNICSNKWEIPQSAAVGLYAANAFGLHDMHGNVWEWVQDCIAYYDQTPTDGTAWIKTDCDARIVRSGSWFSGRHRLRSSFRYWASSNTQGFDLGFRVARTRIP